MVSFVDFNLSHTIQSLETTFTRDNKTTQNFEDELYLMQNQNALNQTSYDKFLELETVVEDLGKEVSK